MSKFARKICGPAKWIKFDPAVSFKTDYFNYRANPSPRLSEFDRFNCSHGTLSDKDYERQASNPTKMEMFVLGDGKNTWQYYRGFNDKLKARRQLVTAANTDAAMSLDFKKHGCLVWQRAEMHIANKNPHPVHMEMFDLLCIEDVPFVSEVVTPFGTYPGNHPLSIMTLEQTREGARIGSATGSQENINDLEYQPERSLRLQKIWKIVNRKKFTLTPGDELNHTVFHKKNFYIDQDLYNVEKEMILGGYIKNVSTCTLFCARGRLGHLSDDQPTWQGVELDTAVKYKSYVREHMPYMDYFAQEYSESFWPGESTGVLRTAVSAYTQNAPVEESGDV